MYIRRSTRKYKGKTYTKYLLVESIHTSKGPRQRTICYLGNLAPAPAEAWRELARRLESALQEQLAQKPSEATCETVRERARRPRRGQPASAPALGPMVKVDTEQVGIEQGRAAGAKGRKGGVDGR